MGMQVNVNQILWAAALAFALYGGWLDGRTRRIPNWFTVTGFVTGVILNTIISGPRGTLAAIEGAGLGLAILLPMVLVRAMGAGDWKLMGAIGALLGPKMLFLVLLASILIAGFMSVVLMIRAKRVRETLRNLSSLILWFLTFGMRTNPEISLDNPRLLKLPFGVAAAIGTVVCFIAVHSQWWATQFTGM
jgi:prepilin peptidase CpaA